MKRVLWFFMFSLPILMTAQDVIPRISIAFQDKTPKEIIEQLGEQTDYQFFYVPQWLGTKVLSGNFENVELSELLDFLFEETNIQYHLGPDKKIYLIRNQTIYDELPSGFFGRKSVQEDITTEVSPSEDSNPIFLNLDKVDGPSEIQTVRIGKASPQARNRKYTLTRICKNPTPLENPYLIWQLL